MTLLLFPPVLPSPARSFSFLSVFDRSSSPVMESSRPAELSRSELSSLLFNSPEQPRCASSFSHFRVSHPPALPQPPPKPPDLSDRRQRSELMIHLLPLDHQSIYSDPRDLCFKSLYTFLDLCVKTTVFTIPGSTARSDNFSGAPRRPFLPSSRQPLCSPPLMPIVAIQQRCISPTGFDEIRLFIITSQNLCLPITFDPLYVGEVPLNGDIFVLSRHFATSALAGKSRSGEYSLISLFPHAAVVSFLSERLIWAWPTKPHLGCRFSTLIGPYPSFVVVCFAYVASPPLGCIRGTFAGIFSSLLVCEMFNSPPSSFGKERSFSSSFFHRKRISPPYPLSCIGVLTSGSFPRNLTNFFTVLCSCVAACTEPEAAARFVSRLSTNPGGEDWVSTSQCKVTKFQHSGFAMKVISTHPNYVPDLLSSYLEDSYASSSICLLLFVLVNEDVTFPPFVS